MEIKDRFTTLWRKYFHNAELPNPRAVIGMFDPSARPYLPKDALSLSVPMAKFITMIENMEDSFLITDTWKKLRKRID
jgi:hypothetical protein